MREEELSRLFNNKEPEELTIDELKKIIPIVTDKIVKNNLIKILESKLGCSISDLNGFDDDGKSFEDLLKEQEERENNPPHQINDDLDDYDGPLFWQHG